MRDIRQRVVFVVENFSRSARFFSALFFFFSLHISVAVKFFTRFFHTHTTLSRARAPNKTNLKNETSQREVTFQTRTPPVIIAVVVVVVGSVFVVVVLLLVAH